MNRLELDRAVVCTIFKEAIQQYKFQFTPTDIQEYLESAVLKDEGVPDLPNFLYTHFFKQDMMVAARTITSRIAANLTKDHHQAFNELFQRVEDIGTHYFYIIKIRKGLFKIGLSGDTDARIKEINRYRADEIEILQTLKMDPHRVQQVETMWTRVLYDFGFFSRGGVRYRIVEYREPL